MKPRKGGAVAAVVGIVFLVLTALPFIFLTLPNPLPRAASAPGSNGNGVYVQDAKGSFQLFPRPMAPDQWPKDAFAALPDVTVFVRSRQYDDMAAYGIFTFPDGKPLRISKRMVDGRMLRLAPAAPLASGRYIVQVSRDDADGGSDFFCLAVER